MSAWRQFRTVSRQLGLTRTVKGVSMSVCFSPGKLEPKIMDTGRIESLVGYSLLDGWF